ncbi:hypothetical protein CAP2UW1_2208 [Sporocytophaga myxococcoides]|uniref:TIR domain-containing protein n=1 Tax=Sporocytophaga myxococcoides TaxID=153721 RepID=A0A098LHA1_9BACT|nr:hypothetical protein [Sporocytophaga myxococcoides]GAL86315.1 hypothetical protein CAP2UW1_2208 [Sporocytophaga myxococcoides]
MEDSNLYLFPDCPSINTGENFWIDYLIKYLSFGLSQKGYNVKVLKDFNDPFEENGTVVYLPVFSEISLSSEDFKERLGKITSSPSILKYGIVKEEKSLGPAAKAYPELKLSKLFLLDPDTGNEVLEKDIFKKEFLNFFLFKIYDLCAELERECNSIANTDTNDRSKSLYLAEVTRDLIPVREEIRRELLQLGYKVYPNSPILGSSKEKEKMINEQIKNCVLSVHLLGKIFEETSEGNIPNYNFENQIAAQYYIDKVEGKSLDFKRIIWIPDNLLIQNENQKKFISQVHKEKKHYAGADIIKSTVEELKDIIIEKLTSNDTVSSPDSTSGEDEGQKAVYIVNSEKNKDGAESVKFMLEEFGYKVFLNRITIDKEKIERSSSILFYYHNEKSSWLRSKMCELYKLKSWEFTSTSFRRGVINFENEELPSDEIFKNVYHVKANGKIDKEVLISFFNTAF